jgi:hypothetical protein
MVEKKKPKKTQHAKRTTRSKDSPATEPHSPEPSTLSGEVIGRRVSPRPARGAGSAAAGQSGDLQGLSRRPQADSESVEELLEEGQTYEAEIVSAIENAPDPDQGEIRAHELPEDDDLA